MLTEPSLNWFGEGSRTNRIRPRSPHHRHRVSVIRRDHLLGRLDCTAAAQAVEDLREWPGQRFGHQPFLGRVWDLRASVRGWDAAYVALAEALGAPLLTLDARLSVAPGPKCQIEVVSQQGEGPKPPEPRPA